MRDEVLKLVEVVRGLLLTPKYQFESNFEALTASDEYRQIVKMGSPALEPLSERLKNGDIFLNRAIMEIAGLKFEHLKLGAFPSEQDISRCLLDLISAKVYWTGGSPAHSTIVIVSALNAAAEIQLGSEIQTPSTNRPNVTSRATSIAGKLQLPSQLSAQ